MLIDPVPSPYVVVKEWVDSSVPFPSNILPLGSLLSSWGVYLEEVTSLDHEILDDSVKCASFVSLWHSVLLVFSCAQLSINSKKK